VVTFLLLSLTRFSSCRICIKRKCHRPAERYVGLRNDAPGLAFVATRNSMMVSDDGSRMTMTPLDRLPLREEETGDLTVVVETPRGSRNKYRYDPAHAVLRLGFVLAEGLSFPVDFGFFPSTLGEDGDPLDVLLLLDNPVPPASAVTAWLIGVLEVEQKEARSSRPPWSRNDRFVAVATQARLHQEITRLAQLRPHLLEEIEAFLVHSTGMNGKTVRILRRSGPPRARQLLKTGERAALKVNGGI